MQFVRRILCDIENETIPTNKKSCGHLGGLGLYEHWVTSVKSVCSGITVKTYVRPSRRWRRTYERFGAIALFRNRFPGLFPLQGLKFPQLMGTHSAAYIPSLAPNALSIKNLGLLHGAQGDSQQIELECRVLEIQGRQGGFEDDLERPLITLAPSSTMPPPRPDPSP